MISKAWHCNADFVIAGTTPSRIARFALLSRGASSMRHAYPTTSNRHAVIDCSAGDNPKTSAGTSFALLRQDTGKTEPSGRPNRREGAVILLNAHDHVEPFGKILLCFVDRQIHRSPLLARR